MENQKNKNPLLFPLIMVSMAAIMYFFAFHSERDKKEELEAKLEKLQTHKQAKK